MTRIDQLKQYYESIGWIEAIKQLEQLQNLEAETKRATQRKMARARRKDGHAKPNRAWTRRRHRLPCYPFDYHVIYVWR